MALDKKIPFFSTKLSFFSISDANYVSIFWIVLFAKSLYKMFIISNAKSDNIFIIFNFISNFIFSHFSFAKLNIHYLQNLFFSFDLLSLWAAGYTGFDGDGDDGLSLSSTKLRGDNKAASIIYNSWMSINIMSLTSPKTKYTTCLKAKEW